MMADPRPLTRNELAEFLPNQRAIRAFEKLFDLIPSELDNLSVEQSLLLSLQSVRSEISQLKQELESLKISSQLAPRPLSGEVNYLRNELEKIKVLIQSIPQPINIDPLIKRVEVLETLEG